MVDPIPAPPAYDPAPAPLSPSVPLNPPMVGEATPFDHVDGTNRDLILEAIRAWNRGPLREWTANWQKTLTDWLNLTDEWLGEWSGAVAAYVVAAIEEFLSNEIELNDAIFTGILNDTGSDAYTKLQTMFAGKSIETIVTSGRLSSANVDNNIETVSADRILNPETVLHDAVVDVASGIFGVGLPTLPMIFDGAMENPNAARPNWNGIVWWFIQVGAPTPVNVRDGDAVFTTDSLPASQIPGYLDTFSGAAAVLSFTESGRKAYEFATRTGLGGCVWSKDGSGNGGLTSSSSGNNTLTANQIATAGTIRLDLGTVVAGNAGIVFNYVDYKNYNYVSRYTSSNARIAMYVVVDGVATQQTPIGTTGFDITSNRVLEVVIPSDNAANIKAYLDGVLALDLPISVNRTGTRSGLYAAGVSGGTVPNYFAKSLQFTPLVAP